MLSKDINFYMIVYTLTEIFHSYLQQVSIFTVFHAVNFLRVSQLPVPVPELGTNSAKPCIIFKSPFMLSMIVTNGGNKLFPTCKSISSKGSIAKHGQNLGTKFYRGERKCIILSFSYLKFKNEVVFLRFSD